MAGSGDDSLNGWFEDVQRTDEGKANLSNILHDSREQRLPDEFIRRFLRAIELAWAATFDPDTSASMAQGIDVLYATSEESPPEWLCRGKTVALRQCARVMDFADLKRYNLRIRATGYPLGRTTAGQIRSLQDNGFRSAIRSLSRARRSRSSIGASSRSQRTLTKGHMSGRRGFAWVTLSDDLDNYRPVAGTSSPGADDVRNVLGICTARRGDHLVAIKYPTSALSVNGLYAPTFIEGTPSKDYRSKGKGDAWGWTAHLGTGIDGLREAVHAALPFNDRFKLYYLGQVQTEQAVDWNKWLAECLHPWEPSAAVELISYVEP